MVPRPAVHHLVYIWHLMINEQRSQPPTPELTKLTHYNTVKEIGTAAERLREIGMFSCIAEAPQKCMHIFKNHNRIRTLQDPSAIAQSTVETKTQTAQKGGNL